MSVITPLLTSTLALGSPPCGPNSMAPFLCRGHDGFWISWLEPDTDEEDTWTLRAAHLADGGTDWTGPVDITRRNDFFVNWADVPRMTVAQDGAITATWLQMNGPGTYAYDVGIARSTRRGTHWTMLGTLNDDRTETEHGFVSLVPTATGARAFWLDGRDMSPEGHDHGHGSGDMALRTAKVEERVGPSTVIDPRTCECCGTAAVMTTAGPIIVYRDRDELERRDISVVRANDDAWSPPVDVHRDEWIIAGCPVNGPALAARGDVVLAAWYTAGPDGGVLAAWSDDAGRTFDAPITLAGEDALGRTSVTMCDKDTALVCWIDDASESAPVRCAHVGRDGTVSRVRTLGQAAPGRSGGFPTTVWTPDGTIVVWTASDRTRGLASDLVPHPPPRTP